MKERRYRMVLFEYNGEKCWTIYYAADGSNTEHDGFVLADESSALYFCRQNDAWRYAEAHQIDLGVNWKDNVQRFLLNVDCGKHGQYGSGFWGDCLDLWNACSDMASSVDQHFIGDLRQPDINTVYMKLFHNCHLPAAGGSPEDALLDEEDWRVLQVVLEDGISLILRSLPPFRMKLPVD